MRSSLSTSRRPLVRMALAALVAALALFAPSSSMPTNGVTVCQYPDTAVQAMTHGPPTTPKATLAATVNADGTATLALTGVAQYKGIVMYVRDAATTTHMGTIALPSALFQTKDCTAAVGSTSGAAGTIQHNSNTLKTVMSFTWTPDAMVTAGQALVAEAVIVESFMNWYMVAPAAFTASTAAAKQAGAAGGAMTTPAVVPPPVPATTMAVPKAATTAAGAVAKPTTAGGLKPTTAAVLKPMTSMTGSLKPPTMAKPTSMMTRTAANMANPLTPTIILTAPTQTCMCYVVQQPVMTMVTRTATVAGMTKPTTAVGAKVSMSSMAAMKMATTAAGAKAMTTAAVAKATTAAAAKPATTAAAAAGNMGSAMNNLQKRKWVEMPKPAAQPVAPANMAMEAPAGMPGAVQAATTAAGAVKPATTAVVAPKPAVSTAAAVSKPAVTPPAMVGMTSGAKPTLPTMASKPTMPTMATKTMPILTKTVKLNRPTECVCVRAVVKKPTNQKHSSSNQSHGSRW
ncbi:hypothetical protein M427DRAFT_155256 [Gonapodya prolifera JEL478]|uniref:Reelin domain-containing protein n=1 Tax=Gonapodya prolifera (strain JEL478) TaxID=1344416 RepID=A0A139AFB6_GONPJ|nr:hypothetical protein M427DRAFT_155256 [Gonapodya prolifera JEL478]|eukprot:KXS15522.1 hypothetical protein M427DRAFT_155256 [Gonapodya prolifera JEL478]